MKTKCKALEQQRLEAMLNIIKEKSPGTLHTCKWCGQRFYIKQKTKRDFCSACKEAYEIEERND